MLSVGDIICIHDSMIDTYGWMDGWIDGQTVMDNR